MSTSDLLLELAGVHVHRGRRHVLRGVDLEVRSGSTTVVLGANGAGKSTLLEAAGGLVPVSSGTLHRHGRVATVLQTPGLARRSVRANVELALRWWGVPARERRDRAMEALELMHASHLARRRADALSGGERRRVHVARGLALRPDLLLLDEPFAGLDSQTRDDLCRDTASALRGSAGAVLVVVHEREDAFALADRLVVLDDGEVVATGELEDVLERPPSPAVARFLGYDGEVVTPAGLVLTRPRHVRPHAAGEHHGSVTRVSLGEAGFRVAIRTGSGLVTAVTHERLRVGDPVRFDLVGGAEFTEGGVATARPSVGGRPSSPGR